MTLGIVIVSAFSAVAAWRSAAEGNKATNTDKIVRQQYTERERLLTSQLEAVVGELDTFAAQEVVAIDAIGDRDASFEELAREDQSLAELRRGLDLLELTSVHDELRFRVDPAGALERARARDPELAALRAEELRAAARQASVKSYRFRGIAALLIGAVALLTISELTSGRRVRILRWSGAATALAGAVLFTLLI